MLPPWILALFFQQFLDPVIVIKTCGLGSKIEDIVHFEDEKVVDISSQHYIFRPTRYDFKRRLLFMRSTVPTVGGDAYKASDTNKRSNVYSSERPLQ